LRPMAPAGEGCQRLRRFVDSVKGRKPKRPSGRKSERPLGMILPHRAG
jgi:hypothetical protein